MISYSKSKRDFLEKIVYLLSVCWGGYLLWLAKNYLFFRPEKSYPIIGTYGQMQEKKLSHFPELQVFIVRDQEGIYALSDICTHRGCQLITDKDRLVCPCHGAEFDFQGNALKGPTNQPLDHYLLYKKRGFIAVDITHNVNRDFRYSE